MTARAFLQLAQDRLAEFYGFPQLLLNWELVKQVLASNPSAAIDIQDKLLAVHHWSLGQTLFHVLEDHPELKLDIQEPLSEVVRKTIRNDEGHAWDPVVSNEGLFGWRRIAIPITDLPIEAPSAMSTGRIPRFILCVGPLRISVKPLSWEEALSKVRERIPDARRALQNQLASELMEIPSRPEESLVLRHAQELQHIWHGVTRDLLPRVVIRQREFSEPGMLERAIYELYRHVRNRLSYYALLSGLVGDLGLSACGVLLRNPSSGTAFLALVLSGTVDAPNRRILSFVPNTESAELAFAARSSRDFAEVPDLTTMNEVASQRHMRCIKIPLAPVVPGGDARLILIGDSKRDVRRAEDRIDSTLRSTIGTALRAWLFEDNVVKARVLQTTERTLLQKRNEIADAIAMVPLPDHESVSGIRSKNLARILSACRAIIGFDHAAYYRASLRNPKPVAVLVASSEGDRVNVFPETLELDSDAFDGLFSRLQPMRTSEGDSCRFPVLAGERAVGFVEFRFSAEFSTDKGMPLMATLVNRLGTRILHRRLLSLLWNVSGLLATRDADVGRRIAEAFAEYFSEAACSLWKYSEENHAFTLIGRHGFNVTLPEELSYAEAQGTALRRCFDGQKPMSVDLRSDGVQVSQELKDQGFQHGLLVPTTAPGYSIILSLWSRATHSPQYFSKDEIGVIRLVSLVLLQSLLLNELIQERENLFDTILAGVGHEVAAPLGFVVESIKLLERGRRLNLSDLTKVAEYVRALIGNFSLYAETNQVDALPDEPQRPIALFGGIIFKAVNVLNWFLERRGLRIVEDFEPTEFPAGVRITAAQERYLFAILFNLLTNAIKYTPAGRKENIRIIGSMGRNWVHVSVSGYSIGVPEEEKERIFDRDFRGSNVYRVSTTGSGLGLHISSKLAKRLGGRLELTQLKSPTVFRLSLPGESAVWDEMEVERHGKSSRSR